jgi:hypothetical protein
MRHGVVQGGSRRRRSGGVVTDEAPGVGCSTVDQSRLEIIYQIGYDLDQLAALRSDSRGLVISSGLAGAPVRRRAFEDDTVR